MAEQSKFAGALGRLKQTSTADKSRHGAIEDNFPPTGKRRAIGKRSDPDYTPTTFFVRKETKRRAAQMLLEDVNSKTDLSDLVEELLAKWISEHSNV